MPKTNKLTLAAAVVVVTADRITADYTGIVDTRGRTCGGTAVIAPARDGGFCVMVLARRDGKGYGPSWTRATVFATREAADAGALAALTRQMNSYAKKFPVTVAA